MNQAEAINKIEQLTNRASLERRAKGLRKAWAGDGGPAQPDLFQEAI